MGMFIPREEWPEGKSYQWVLSNSTGNVPRDRHPGVDLAEDRFGNVFYGDLVLIEIPTGKGN